MKYVDKYSLAAFVLWLASFVIYLNYYDILIPGLPGGSYRLAIGGLFAIPAFLLSAGQVIIGSLIIFALVKLFRKKAHETKSFLISSVMVFFFSLTYVLFPFFGPFYYIVFVTDIAPPHVIEIEILWTVLLIAISTALMSELHKMRLKDAFITVVVTGVFIVVAAS